MKYDPRTKMILVICISTLAMVYNSPVRLLALLAVSGVLLKIFGFELRAVGAYLRRFLYLMMFLFVVQAVFSPGDDGLLTWGSTAFISTQGLLNAGSMVLRILVITVLALLFTTFSSRDFILGLVQWRVPYEIAFMVSIALRFLPTFRDELSNAVTAVQLRGVELRKIPWGQKIDMFRHLIFPVVYRTMMKAEQLALAMESRGFRAYPRRTYLRRLYFRPGDYLVMAGSIAITLGLLVLHFN